MISRRLWRASAALALGVGLLGAPAPAQAASANAEAVVPTYMPQRTQQDLAMRLAQLEAYVDQLAQGVGATFPLQDLRAFCTPFRDLEMPQMTDPLWRELSRIPRRQLIAQLARFVRACEYSRGAGNRAGFLLDYLYWNRLADTTGYEVAQVLVVRDVFYEIYVNQLTQVHVHTNDLARKQKGSPRPEDFLDAPPMARINWFRSFADFINSFSPNERRVFNVMIELVDFREGYLTPFGAAIQKILENPDDVRVVEQFYAYLMYVRSHPALLAERHGGWHKLMALTGGSPSQAMRIFGVIASLVSMPLEEVAPALAFRGRLEPHIVQALHDGAMAYYVMNTLDEWAARPSPKSQVSLDYHFFYPDTFETTNWKWYHYYNQAWVGCELRRRGYPAEAIVASARLMATFYEGTTLNLAIPSRRTLSVDPRATPIVESNEDVVLNAQGARYGVEVCK